MFSFFFPLLAIAFSYTELGMVDREIDKHVDLLPQVRAASRRPIAGGRRRPGKVGATDGTGSDQSRAGQDQGETRVRDQSRETGAGFQVSVFENRFDFAAARAASIDTTVPTTDLFDFRVFYPVRCQKRSGGAINRFFPKVN